MWAAGSHYTRNVHNPDRFDCFGTPIDTAARAVNVIGHSFRCLHFKRNQVKIKATGITIHVYFRSASASHGIFEHVTVGYRMRYTSTVWSRKRIGLVHCIGVPSSHRHAPTEHDKQLFVDFSGVCIKINASQIPFEVGYWLSLTFVLLVFAPCFVRQMVLTLAFSAREKQTSFQRIEPHCWSFLNFFFIFVL